MTETIRVTVAVETDDIRDVLAYYSEGSGAVHNRRTRQILSTYHDHTIPPERREAFWDSLPVSLRYCIHEVELGRAGALRAVLAEGEFDCG